LCDSGRRSFRAAHVGNNGRIGAFTCHKCSASGDIVDIFIRAYRMTREKAQEMSGQVAHDLRRRGRHRARRVSKTLGMEHIAPYRRTLSKWLVERGYEEEWIWHYRVGMDLWTNEIVLPTYNVEGDLVGITRRVAEDGQPAVHIGDFDKSNHLWGIDLAIKSGESCVYLVEGQTGTLGAAPVVAPCPVVASFGSELSDTQAKLLADHFSTVVIVYDDDMAGWKGTDRARRKLRRCGVSDLFVGFVPEDVDDTGELPFAECPKIEHVGFREWKRIVGWRSRYASRNNSSKEGSGTLKRTAQSQRKFEVQKVLAQRRW